MNVLNSYQNKLIELENKFIRIFNCKSEGVYKVPARINLIGEHIDYNGGKVLPCTISYYMTGLFSCRLDKRVVVYSNKFDSKFSAEIDTISFKKRNSWSNYVFGIFATLKGQGYIIPRGLNIFIDSDISLGAGLSSSAALLDLVIFIVNDVFKLGIDLMTLAKLAHRTENEFCGLKCGIMDQTAIILGQKNNAILLDCSNLRYDYKEMALRTYFFVVLKTNMPHNLVKSKYNERVEECEKALEIIKKRFNVNNLCELFEYQLPECEKLLNDPTLYKRVKHVVTENERVQQFSSMMTLGKTEEMGRLLNESHRSLKEDYEVTGEYLDTIVEAALHSGSIGARMTGGGFGGCAIALISSKIFEDFKTNVDKEYFAKLKIHPTIEKIEIVDGPQKIK
ncbi:MAG: galactokinase [Bacilli bacterium]|nr:galactokinase [Bacilli bacterium]